MPGKGKGKKGKKGKGKTPPPQLNLPPEVRTAAADGDDVAVRTFLDGGGSIEATHQNPAFPDRGRTMLILACRGGHLTLLSMLLHRGAKIDQVDSNGATALMHACARGHPHIVQTLLWAGARPEITNFLGHGPLDWAGDRPDGEWGDSHSGHAECYNLVATQFERNAEAALESPQAIATGATTPAATSPAGAIWAGV